ncbi:MAG: DUF4274 domain-containing protein [Pseudomonadota bacterium]
MQRFLFQALLGVASFALKTSAGRAAKTRPTTPDVAALRAKQRAREEAERQAFFDAQAARKAKDAEEKSRRAARAAKIWAEDDKLRTLIAPLRPGMAASLLGDIAAQLGGHYTAPRMQTFMIWAPADGSQYTVKVDGDTLAYVSFRESFHDPEGVSSFATYDAALAGLAGARAVDDLTPAEARPAYQLLEQDLPGQDYSAVHWFREGKFVGTTYVSPKARETAAAKLLAQAAQKVPWDGDMRGFQGAELPRSFAEGLTAAEMSPQEANAAYAEVVARRDAGPDGEDYAAFADWLVRHSTAEDRAFLMEGYNWDNGLDLVRWIVRQPDTDIATIAALFWDGEPSAFYRAVEADIRPAVSSDLFDLHVEIGARFARGFYQAPAGRAPIGFTPPPVPKIPPSARVLQTFIPPAFLHIIKGHDPAALGAAVPPRWVELMCG